MKRVSHQKEKTKFRGTKKWKDFRDRMRKKQQKDPITGAKLGRMANLHHCDLDESHYEDISNEDNFVFLNKMSHDVVHFFFSKTKPHQWRERIANIIPILEKMEELNAHKL
jgi:hypothetical protein